MIYCVFVCLFKVLEGIPVFFFGGYFCSVCYCGYSGVFGAYSF